MQEDLISRQAVLALPRNITRNIRGEVVEETIDVAAIKELPPAQPEQRWTPTSKKPPEPFKLVLIQDSWGGYELKMYIPPRIKPKKYPNGYWGEVDGVDYDYFDVEAWYPLPEEYRPEGDKKHEG